MEAVANPASSDQFQHALLQGCSPSVALDWISDDLREQLSVALSSNLDLFPAFPKPLTWEQRTNTWLLPAEYQEFDIESHIISLARNSVDSERIQYELGEFRSRNLLPVLKTIKYLVDTMRSKNIVWGVGRGSSVSSLVLFLLGINRIDPVRWNLDATEFFK